MTATQETFRPMPRSGFIGHWDRFVGPGTTPTENGLILTSAIVGTVGVIGYAIVNDLGWSLVQLLVIGLVALDLFGGAVANATRTTARWYHRDGQTAWHHLGFVALHVVHPLLIMAFFRPGDWAFVIVVYGYLMLAAVGVVAAPDSLKRPVAAVMMLVAFVVVPWMIVPTSGQSWFVPVLAYKLIVGHLVGA